MDGSKEAHVELLYSSYKKKFYLLFQSPCRHDVQLLRFDSVTGDVKFHGTFGRDIFDTKLAAIEYLRKEGAVEKVARGVAVLGYVVIGPTALLLLAEKTKTTAVLPGGHAVKTVVRSKWQKINLEQPQVDSISNKTLQEQIDSNITKITTFPIDDVMFFCETMDLTRPFPSQYKVEDPCWEFVWNRWLSAPFRNKSLDYMCPPIVHGMCDAVELFDLEARPYTVVLVSRRSRLHAGPRYKARGINNLAGPGNEVECEQIIYRRDMRDGGKCMWSTYTWRRGSVPLNWSVNLSVSNAEIIIQQKRTFKGSRRYCRRLQKRFCPNPTLNSDFDPMTTPSPMFDPTKDVPITFLSLLRKGSFEKEKSETQLAAAFAHIVNRIRSTHDMDLMFVGLDWHEMDAQLGHEGVVEALWCQVEHVLPKHGFTLGTMTQTQSLGHGDHPLDASASSQTSPPTDNCWKVQWHQQQIGVVRYNCADSLDRTNVGSFYCGVQVFVEQCRALDIVVWAGGSSNSGLKSTPPAPSKPMPHAKSTPSTSSTLKVHFDRMKGELSRWAAPLNQAVNRSAAVDAAIAPLVPQPLPPTPPPTSPSPAESKAVMASLPTGWDAVYQPDHQRWLYVDHTAKTTTWIHPNMNLQSQPLPQSRPGPSTSSPVNHSSPQQPFPSFPKTPSISSASDSPSSSHPHVRSVSTGGQVGGHSADGITKSLSNTSLGRMSHSKSASSMSGSAQQSESDTESLTPLMPWEMLRMRASKFSKRVMQEAMTALAELFLKNGDIIAEMYTGSQAMHSDKLLLFEPEGSRLRRMAASAVGNGLIAVQRRFQNFLVDEERLVQVELFLGVKLPTYFPGVKVSFKDEGAPLFDSSETDDEQDPLAQENWPPHDKILPPPATTTELQSPKGSVRHRRQFSSSDFVEHMKHPVKFMLPSFQSTPPTSPSAINAHLARAKSYCTLESSEGSPSTPTIVQRSSASEAVPNGHLSRQDSGTDGSECSDGDEIRHGARSMPPDYLTGITTSRLAN